MFEINLRDKQPIYEQLRAQLLRQVSLGILPPGTPLPSVRSLSLDLGVNPNTVQKAYRLMEADGLICSIPGKGSFVADNAAAQRLRRQSELLTRLGVLAKEAKETGLTAEMVRKAVDSVFEED